MRGWWIISCLAFVAARGSDNWPRVYNNGVEAYRSNDFTAAAQDFERALPSTDSNVQHRAFYNFGNACYRLGEAQPPQAQQFWQRAIKNYESALTLDPNDADAKFNRDFVKKKLEELKKQEQQQQQQNQQDKKQNQDKNDQQQQQKDQNEQQNQQQQKPEDKQSEQQQPKPEQAKQQSQPQSQQEEQPRQASSDNLDKRQAAALLDDLREDERNWNFFPEVQMKDLKDKGEPAKDW